MYFMNEFEIIAAASVIIGIIFAFEPHFLIGMQYLHESQLCLMHSLALTKVL